METLVLNLTHCQLGQGLEQGGNAVIRGGQTSSKPAREAQDPWVLGALCTKARPHPDTARPGPSWSLSCWLANAGTLLQVPSLLAPPLRANQELQGEHRVWETPLNRF